MIADDLPLIPSLLMPLWPKLGLMQGSQAWHLQLMHPVTEVSLPI